VSAFAFTAACTECAGTFEQLSVDWDADMGSSAVVQCAKCGANYVILITMRPVPSREERLRNAAAEALDWVVDYA